MQRTPITATKLSGPQVVFGTSAFGNLYQQTSNEGRCAIVQEMLEHIPDVIALDSAGKYGAGLALETLGETLSSLNVPKDRVCISNKLGWRRVPLKTKEPTFEPGVWVGIEHDAVQDISYDGILRCWEQGNQLLGDYESQLVSVHDPDEYLAVATSEMDRQSRWNDILEAYRALGELRESGLTQGIGVGSKDWRIARDLADCCQLDWVMIANCLTVYRHEPELLRFVESLHQRGVSVINSAIFHGGFLVGREYFDYRKLDPESVLDASILLWREQFYAICKQYDADPAKVCASFAVSPPGVSAIAFNTSRPEKVASNLKLADGQFDERIWNEMKAQGLISSDYPYIGMCSNVSGSNK